MSVTGDGSANTIRLAGTWNYDLDGAGGDDFLRSGSGADRLDGSDGNDTLRGGGGDDTLIGGGGNDRFIVNGEADLVIEARTGGMDRVISSATSYTLAAGVENLTLRSDAVDGSGNGLGNRIFGNTGANTLHGAGGNDTVHGGAGNDGLAGGGGDDVLIGSAGVDRLAGGAGADTFRFANVSHSGIGAGSRDVVLDFVQGTDRIDLGGIDANSRAVGDQAFTLIQGAVFTSTAGELRCVQRGGSTVLQGDVNGDAVADFHLEIVGLPPLTAGDLLL